jgi:transcriptional regulator with XRE-family HTH domain
VVAPEVETFGDLLRQFRLACALSQEALAERARLSVAAIAALERGRRTAPRADTVALLADGLELSAANRARFIGAAMAVKQPMPSSVALADDPTPLSSTSTLPAPPTPLIGREEEEVRLGEALRSAVLGGARLLTLTGPGGVGKTRLALAVAAAQQDLFADGVFWVDLSDARDPALTASVVGQALGLKPEGAQAAREALIARLKSSQALLILDNFEQVLEAASLVSDLIASCALPAKSRARTALGGAGRLCRHAPLRGSGPRGAAGLHATG